jgi:mannose-6-phosphate isomerase-like protein (cupin superfamily)
MIMTVLNVERELSRFSDHWSPKIVAELNGQCLKLAKLKGTFVWHEHASEDELFLVLKGTLRIMLEDGEIILREGDLTVIPKGVRHLPVADEEVHVLLLEPASTVSTGEVEDPRATRGVRL